MESEISDVSRSFFSTSPGGINPASRRGARPLLANGVRAMRPFGDHQRHLARQVPAAGEQDGSRNEQCGYGRQQGAAIRFSGS